MTATIQISSLSRLFFRAFFFLPPLGQKGTKRKDIFESKKTPSRDFACSGCFRARSFCEEEETTSSSSYSFLASRSLFGASRRKLLFFLFFFAETAFLQFNSTREKKIKNTRTQTDHASLKIIHFLDDDDDDDEKDARSRIKPKQIWMFFLLVLVRFVLRDARSNEREFSEIGNRVLGKSDEQFEPNRVVFGSSESEG